MRQRAAEVLFWMFCFLLVLGVSHRAEAACYNTEWIGSEEKTYEMAWVQKNGTRPNGEKYQFTFKRHFRIDGNQRIPIYCIDYYKAGPEADQKYVEKTLPEQNLPEKVKQGFCNILRNGYPNVDRPYGTQDDAEAYYATGAAMHIWSIYYGVDKEGAEKLGWFSPDSGFSMTARDLSIYQAARTTGTTCEGTHIITTNPNPSSRRTWFAAMELLIDALEEPATGKISLTTAHDFQIQGQYFQWTVQLEQENCSSWKIVGEDLPEGTIITPAGGTETRKTIECKVPINSATSKKKVTLKAEAVVPGGNLEDSYVLSDSVDPLYQRMFMLRYQDLRSIVSSKVSAVTGDCACTIEYDLNYSGSNYIRRGIGLLYNHANKLFCRSGLNCSVTASTKLADRESVYVIGDRNMSSKNPYSCAFYTDANGSRDAGYPDETLYTVFRFDAKTKNDVLMKIWWEGSGDPVSVTIKGGDEYNAYNVLTPKKPQYGSILYIYFKSQYNITFKCIQVTEGERDEKLENAPVGDPKTSSHCIGQKYGSLYDGKIPEREGYTFLGWNTKKNGKGVFVTDQSLVTDPRRVLYAVWEEIPSGKVYYHYKHHGGTSLKLDKDTEYTGQDDVYAVPMKEGDTIPVTYEAARPGWTFSGWSLNGDLSRLEQKEEAMVMGKEDVHLYANFEKNIQLYFHYFNPKTGKEETYTDRTLWRYNGNPPESAAYAPACGKSERDGYVIPAVPGYEFSGWCMERNGQAAIKGDQPVAPGEDTHFYAGYEKKITVTFVDCMTGHSGEHENQSCHAAKTGVAGMASDGTLLPASIQVPETPCVENGWEFWGWCLEKNNPAAMDIFPEMNGQTLDVTESATYFGYTRKKVTVEFFDWSPAHGAHREYTAEHYRVRNAYGDVKDGKTKTPYLCTETGWENRGWSLEEEGSSPVHLKEGQWITVTEDRKYYGSRHRKASAAFYHGEEQYAGGRWKLKKTLLSRTEGDVFKNWKGRITGATVTVPKPYEGTDWGRLNGMERWTRPGFASEESVSGSPDIQCVPGDVLQLKNHAVYYAVYQRPLKIRYFDLDASGEQHLHGEESSVVYMDCQGIRFPVSHFADAPCLTPGKTFYGWEEKNAATGNTLFYPVSPGSRRTLTEDTDFAAVYDPDYEPVFPTEGPMPTAAPEPETPDRFVRSISTAYLYTLLPGSKWRPGGSGEENDGESAGVTPYELLKNSLEKDRNEYEYRWVVSPGQVNRAQELLRDGLLSSEDGRFLELLEECKAVSGS